MYYIIYKGKKRKKKDSFHISCKFQMLIKPAWFQYRNPNVQRFYTFILSHF